jgi:hypothetical protein
MIAPQCQCGPRSAKRKLTGTARTQRDQHTLARKRARGCSCNYTPARPPATMHATMHTHTHARGQKVRATFSLSSSPIRLTSSQHSRSASCAQRSHKPNCVRSCERACVRAGLRGSLRTRGHAVHYARRASTLSQRVIAAAVRSRASASPTSAITPGASRSARTCSRSDSVHSPQCTHAPRRSSDAAEGVRPHALPRRDRAMRGDAQR